MADISFNHVTIIGVGLLGGSAALALKAADPDIRIAGVGRRQSSLDDALRVGAIDSASLDAADAVAKTDLVILATPVGAFHKHLQAVVDHLPDGVTITDVGSTKAGVVRAAERILGRGGPFVGSHPMAGSEKKGVSYARADLFAGATCILTPTKHTPGDITDRAERLWRALGMRTVRMTPQQHDRVLARVSHLPHVLASLLMLLPQTSDLDVSASGFRDATRLASGDPEMWRDILMTNRRAILHAIDGFEESLMRLRDILELNSAPAVEEFLQAAKKRRDTTIVQRLAERRVSSE